MLITNGNHDEIPKRKLKTVGLASEMVADYNRLYELGAGWDWVNSFEFDCYGAKPVLVPMHMQKNSRWDRRVI